MINKPSLLLYSTIISACVFVWSSGALGQNFDIQTSLGTHSSAKTASIGLSMHWSFLDKYPIEVGGGARYNYFVGSDFVVETAEHDLIQDGETLKLQMPSGQLQSANLFISIVGGVYDAFSLGFNLDVVGVSWGPSTSARRNREGGMIDLVMTPTRWNFLKGDTRDLGSLNSEFFAQWKFSDTYLARIGWSHYFAEWKAQSTLEGAGNRFRIISNLLLVSGVIRY